MSIRNNLDSNYWTNRYANLEASWDVGEVSRPIKEYVDQLCLDNRKILIPGCGNGYEGEYLLNKGFENIYFLDFSLLPLKNIKERCPKIPNENFICKSIFDLDGEFDLIIEQTLFCALDPVLRKEYVCKLSSLLSPKGKLVGVLFNKEFESGPPFGGSKPEYIELFSKYFHNIYIEDCYNSILKREGSELFISMRDRKLGL
jgi:hypothetical protein